MMKNNIDSLKVTLTNSITQQVLELNDVGFYNI